MPRSPRLIALWGIRLCLTILSWNSQALFKARETFLPRRMQPGWFRLPDYQPEPRAGATVLAGLFYLLTWCAEVCALGAAARAYLHGMPASFTDKNAKNAKDGAHQRNGNVRPRDVLGVLRVLGVGCGCRLSVC